MPKLADVTSLAGYTEDISALEDEADALHHDLLASCSASPPEDLLRVLALKEVVDTLEDAADAFEKVANTVESIAVKES